MSKTIWKFEFHINDQVSIDMPRGATILSVQMQHNRPTVWAEVDPAAPMVPVLLEIFGTGNPMSADPHGRRTHIATIQEQGRPLVWHVYLRYTGPKPV